MAIGNTVTLVGNVTRDPELRFTPSGQAIATFGLAVNRRWQNRQTNEWEEAVSFFDVVGWAQMAENVGESVRRAPACVVTGRLEQRSWETDDGDKRSKIEIVADEIAPSLRWATAEVAQERAQRRRRQLRRRRRWRRRRQSRRAPSRTSPAGYDSDEEPF